jgi:hypothetical protein
MRAGSRSRGIYQELAHERCFFGQPLSQNVVAIGKTVSQGVATVLQHILSRYFLRTEKGPIRFFCARLSRM